MKSTSHILKRGHVLILVLILGTCYTSCKNEPKQETRESLVDYVNPFIGTGGHGHTFPGATAPFGMVQPSPGNGITGWDWCSGYHISDSIISGFGQLHLSGTGIGDLTDVLLMPTNKSVDVTLFGTSRDSLPYTSSFPHSSELASPGYYEVYLEEPKVDVALTANDYVAFHKYTFREENNPSFILDLGFAVNWDKPTEGHIAVENENRLVGYRFSTGWAKNQKVFFVIETSKPITTHQLVTDGKAVEGMSSVKGKKTGGQFFFTKDSLKTVDVKVALSSVSIDNAKENLRQQGAEQNFEEIKNRTSKQWESLLAKIQVETPIDSLKTIFYTALYHTQIAPVLFSDVNNEFRLQNDSIVKTSGKTYSTLSLWDTFRAENPLLNLLHPEKVSDIIQSMLAYYDEQGRLPVWTLYGNETDTMTGNHGVSVICEAFLKGIRGFNIEKAYAAVRETMMGDIRGLGPYKKYGYIPFTELDESVTITLEFAYNDWCVAQMARVLGKNDDHDYFLKRSKAYQYLFDAKTGFMRGKSVDGKSWNEPFDPKYSNHREHTDYTEGNAWQHSWFVLHDVADFIGLHGGNDAFTKKLEQLFTETSEISGDNISADISGLIGQYAHGNEPSHHIAYMFNRAQHPWKTQYWVREILDTQYSTKPDGLSGNEDCGQMSAWYVFSSLGFYPMNPASGQYELGSPIFEKATITLSGDKKFEVIAKNTSATNKYIQSVKLNGKLLERTYIDHSEILAGGTLEFEMGPEPNKMWGIN
ncbi:GH92 family glycosyl hydrolase [Flagellimonas sp. HMM57]|uniref:GH92 family glycosyl hydrolase n=1 Tax=unclassified Flagellimonas TaxID=2644544 RepID=UPI0013D8C23E|nr:MULTISPECIES: GH92 family glycosyl hydrolase [unclassified Flagellimonas]UII74758.1 GH92 family glycosyl hydrolase [Flagellimonas sp. HMM57]